MDFSDDLLELMAESPRIAKHVHAPLQSGSRPHPAPHASQVPAAALCRSRREGARPDAGCGDRRRRDGGLPRRDRRRFRREPPVHRGLPFTYLHVFTYSERPGTPAARDAGSVPMPVRKERNRVLRELAAAKNLAFRERMVGRTLSAVTLHTPGARSPATISRWSLRGTREPNAIVEVKIRDVSEAGLFEAD